MEKELATVDQSTAKVVESLVVRGDLSGLSPTDRARYYIKACNDLGLNPTAQPFAFLRLNGKEILYATRGATDQLAKIHRVNREVIDGPKVIDLAGTKLVFCVVKASLPDGRVETATATVPLADPVNVLMKCETKGKRRATLSILGLGVLDECELETIPAGAQEPGSHVDLGRAQGGGEGEYVEVAVEPEEPTADGDRPTLEEPAALVEFNRAVDGIELPGEAVAVWIKHRAAISALPPADREAAWKALCKRTEDVGRMKNAKVWLKKAIAEEDNRRAVNPDAVTVDGSTHLDLAEAPLAKPAGLTPTEVSEVLGGIQAARDLATLKTLRAALEADELTRATEVQARHIHAALAAREGELKGGPGPRGGSKPARTAPAANANGGAVEASGSEAPRGSLDVVDTLGAHDSKGRPMETRGQRLARLAEIHYIPAVRDSYQRHARLPGYREDCLARAQALSPSSDPAVLLLWLDPTAKVAA